MFLPDGEVRYQVAIFIYSFRQDERILTGYDFGSDLEKAKEGFEKLSWVNDNSKQFTKPIIRLMKYWTEHSDMVRAKKEVILGPPIEFKRIEKPAG